MAAAWGDEADRGWALEVVGAFVVANASGASARRHLRRAVADVEASGESPTELFGATLGTVLLATRRLSRRTTRARADAPDDHAWAREIAGLLRVHAGLTDRRVREVVAEARAHAKDSGVRVAEEFGPPASYAARFRTDKNATLRRRAWGFTAIFAVVIVIQVSSAIEDGTLNWWRVGLIVIMALFTVSAWRDVRREAHGAHARTTV
ncbi:MAG: hypothetical protein Q4G34_11355 [Micrococcus sp.]|nr:hypothetical protein [Micrococcus sp.]